MRDLLTGLAIIVILALCAAMAAPWFIDWNAWRGPIEQRLTAALGRDVRIQGDLAINFLPQPRVSAQRVTIEAAHEPASMTIAAMDVEFGLTALLSGDLRVTDGVVDRPVITWRDAPRPGPSSAGAIPSRLWIEHLIVRGGELRSVAADGRVLFAARSDLTIEASRLVGPWKAQGRAEIGGRRYDLRWSSGALDEQGRAAMKMAIQDAGLAFVADAEGTLTVDRKADGAPPRFDGRVTASGMLPWPFGKAAGAQPWRLSANGFGDVGGFTARELDIEAGPQDLGVKAEGEGVMRFADAVGARVRLKARPVDIDRMLAAEPGQPTAAAPADSIAETERLIAGIPFPIAFDLAVDRAYARGDTVGPISASGKLEPGAIAIDRAEAQAPGGAKAQASGRMWIDSEPAIEARINLASSSPAKTWQWVTGAAPETVAQQRFVRASTAAASGRLRWRPGRLAFDEGVVELDGAKAQVSAQRRFATQGDPGRVGLDVRADRLDLDLFPPLDAFAPTDGPDINVSVAAKNVVSATLGLSIGALDLEARQQNGALTLQRFSLTQKGLSFSADGVVKNGVGRFTSELAADDLKPLAAAMQRAYPGKAADALAARASELSPAKLSGSLQPSRDGKRWLLRVDGAAGGTALVAGAEARPGDGPLAVNLEVLRVNAQSSDAGKLARQLGWQANASDRPGSLALAIGALGDATPSFTINATFAGAAIEASGRAADTLTPSLSGRFRINSADLSPALRMIKFPLAASAAQRGWLEGKLDLGVAGLRLAELRGDIGGVAFGGGPLLMSLGDERKVSGQIEIGQMALADVSLMALGVDGAPGAGGFWSSARFPTFAAWPMAFDLDLRASMLKIGGDWRATDASMRLISRNDGLRIDSFSGDVAGGKASGNATIRRDGGLAAITGRIDLAKADLAMLGATGLTSQMDLSLDFAGNGDTLSRIVAGLGGAGSLTLRKMSLPRLDAGAAARVIASQAKAEAMPTMAILTPLVEQELDRAPFALETLAAPLTVANGAARIGPARVDSKVARAAASAQIDLRNWTLDARGAIVGLGVDGAPSPEIGFAYVGPLSAPRRSVDIAALFSDLTQRAAAREAERVETLEQDARERAAFNRRLRSDRQRSDAEARAARPPTPAPPAAAPSFSLAPPPAVTQPPTIDAPPAP